MPTYQYACTVCGAKHEAVQSFTDAHLTECPACGGLLRKVFSAVGVVFKGSGFYKTDSRSGDKADGAKKDGSTSSAPATAGTDGTAPASAPATAAAPATTGAGTSGTGKSGAGSAPAAPTKSAPAPATSA